MYNLLVISERLRTPLLHHSFSEWGQTNELRSFVGLLLRYLKPHGYRLPRQRLRLWRDIGRSPDGVLITDAASKISGAYRNAPRQSQVVGRPTATFRYRTLIPAFSSGTRILPGLCSPWVSRSISSTTWAVVRWPPAFGQPQASRDAPG